MRTPFLVGFALAASAACAATPSLAGGAAGFQVRAHATAEADGLDVHGDVCRRAPHAVASNAGVQVEERDAEGRVVARVTAPLSRTMSPRSNGCAFFHASLPAKPAGGAIQARFAGETLNVGS